MRSPHLLDFGNLPHPNKSQLSPDVLETQNSLESSMGGGEDAILSTSQNERTGKRLMEQHTGRGTIGGGELVFFNSAGPQMGGESGLIVDVPLSVLARPMAKVTNLKCLAVDLSL